MPNLLTYPYRFHSQTLLILEGLSTIEITIYLREPHVTSLKAHMTSSSLSCSSAPMESTSPFISRFSFSLFDKCPSHGIHLYYSSTLSLAHAQKQTLNGYAYLLIHFPTQFLDITTLVVLRAINSMMEVIFLRIGTSTGFVRAIFLFHSCCSHTCNIIPGLTYSMLKFDTSPCHISIS